MKIEIILGMGFSNIFGNSKAMLESDAAEITVEEAVRQFLKQNREFHDKIKTQKILYRGSIQAVYVVDGQVVKKKFIIKKYSTLKILPAIGGG